MRAWWARRLKRQVPAIEYYSISPAGHCPHHEVPHTVNVLIQEWIRSKVRRVLQAVSERQGSRQDHLNPHAICNWHMQTLRLRARNTLPALYLFKPWPACVWVEVRCVDARPYLPEVQLDSCVTMSSCSPRTVVPINSGRPAAAVGKPNHRISQISVMTDRMSMKTFAFWCYEL